MSFPPALAAGKPKPCILIQSGIIKADASPDHAPWRWVGFAGQNAEAPEMALKLRQSGWAAECASRANKLIYNDVSWLAWPLQITLEA